MMPIVLCEASCVKVQNETNGWAKISGMSEQVLVFWCHCRTIPTPWHGAGARFWLHCDTWQSGGGLIQVDIVMQPGSVSLERGSASARILPTRLPARRPLVNTAVLKYCLASAAGLSV